MSANPNPATVVATDLHLSVLVDSTTNPRPEADFKGKDFDELVASIREQGVLQPILVRPIGEPFEADRYEIVCGHRRTRAARAAGEVTIPARVRTGMTDEQAAEAQLVENLQRKGLDPVEEALGMLRLNRKPPEGSGLTPKEIAGRIGKSVSYVYQRLVLSNLSKDAVTALRAGKISLRSAFLLARIPDDGEREEATARVLEPWKRNGEGWRQKGEALDDEDVEDLVREHYLYQLASAPFDTKDADLVPAAGACTKCPKRSGNAPALFDDVGKKDVCTDGACFQAKVSAAWEKETGPAKAKGLKILSAAESAKVFPSYYANGSMASGSGYVDLKEKNYSDPKGRTWKQILGEDAAPVIARDQDGKARHLVPRKEAERIAKENGVKVKSSSSSSDASWEKKERAEQKARERKKLTMRRVLVQIGEKAELPDPSRQPGRDQIAALALLVLDRCGEGKDLLAKELLEKPGKGAAYNWEERAFAKRIGEMRDLTQPVAAKDAFAAGTRELWGFLVQLVLSLGAANHYVHGYGDGQKHLKALAKLYGIDVDKVAREVLAEDQAKEKAKAPKKPAKKKSATKKKGAA